MLTRQQWLQQRSPIPTLSLSHTHTHPPPPRYLCLLMRENLRSEAPEGLGIERRWFEERCVLSVVDVLEGGLDKLAPLLQQSRPMSVDPIVGLIISACKEFKKQSFPSLHHAVADRCNVSHVPSSRWLLCFLVLLWLLLIVSLFHFSIPYVIRWFCLVSFFFPVCLQYGIQ